MGAISGKRMKAGVKIASTWGTAVALGAGNGVAVEITPNFNVTEVVRRMIGSGRVMAAKPIRGNFIPTFGLVGDAGYDNGMATVLAQILGTAGAPTETTPSEGDYKHVLKLNTTLNSKYLTFGYQNTDATTVVCPTAACRSFNLRSTTIPGVVEWAAELLGNDVEFTPGTNDFSDLSALTIPDDEPIVMAFPSSFWVDDHDSAAIDSTDGLAITSFDFSLQRPQDITPEAKGSAGNSAPLEGDLITANLAIGLAKLTDNTWYTVWSAETVKKGIITIEGDQIGGGVNKSLKLYIPNLCLVQEPSNPMTAPGVNPATLNFTVAAPASTVTGMTASIYPYFELTNEKSGDYLS